MTEMNENNDSSFPRSRAKKQSNSVLYLFIITILALTGGFFFYQKNVSSLQQGDELASSQQEQTENTSLSRQTDTEQFSDNSDTSPLPSANDSTLSTKKATSFDQVTIDPSDGQNYTLSDQAPVLDQVAGLPDSEIPLSRLVDANQNDPEIQYSELLTRLDNFYSHLDSQPYMQAFKLPEPSKTHFSKLIQKLLDNPPVVTRETDDLFTLLKNTAHFFRIIGKDNILVLKGILDREKDSFESILHTLFILTSQPKILEDAYSIKLDQNALYDYAGFFLNTMGGRLYLFRRDSNSRMAVSFYAIMIVERANNSGNSRHGIDIRPAIDSLIDEIENGGNKLQKREQYLDALYDLKEKYG